MTLHCSVIPHTHSTFCIASALNPTSPTGPPASPPPRGEEELDPVTLHNSALAAMESDPAGGFRKLNYLLGLGEGGMWQGAGRRKRAATGQG